LDETGLRQVLAMRLALARTLGPLTYRSATDCFRQQLFLLDIFMVMGKTKAFEMPDKPTWRSAVPGVLARSFSSGRGIKPQAYS